MTSKLIVGGFIAAAWLCVPLRAQEPPPRALEAIREAQNPVVFVHGFCSGNDTWQATQAELQRRGWKSGGALIDPASPAFSSEANADYYLVQFTDPLIQNGIQESWSTELALYLRRIAAHRRANGLGQPRFTLVAHSAGGLASRAYLQSSVYIDDLWHLITYGTPHLGTSLANLRPLAELAPGRCRGLPAFAVSQGVQEMDPDSQFLRTLNERPSPRDVYFTSLIGFSSDCSRYLPGESDCIVPTRSQDIRLIRNPPFADRVVALAVSGQNHTTETSDAGSILYAIDRLSPPPVLVPGVPQSVSGSVAGNRITLNWLAPTTGGQISEYVVRAGTARGAYNLFNGSVGAGTSVTETVASGTYHISVAARNATGVGPDSPEITVVVGVAVPVPGAPRSVTGSASGNTITVNWQAPLTGAPIANYVVRAGNTAPGVYNLYNGSVGTQTSVSETVANGTYYVSVAAQNATGVGPASTEIRVVVGVAGPAPIPTPCPNRPTGTFTLNAGETIRMSFTTAPLPTADFMVTTLGGIADNLSWTLFNGSVVLGSQTASGSGPFWKSSSSLSSFSPAQVVDFRSIVNGTIDGRVEAKADRTLTLDLSRAAVSIGHGRSDGGVDFFSQPSFRLALISTSCR